MKLLKTLILVLIPILSFGQTTIFSENFGNPTSTTLVSSYTGWQNNGVLAFSGNADIRSTVNSASCNPGGTTPCYTGASGQGNLFITSTLNTNCVIGSINTSNYTLLSLSFGILKTTNASNGSELRVQTSPDGTTWTNMSFTMATGGGSSNSWTYITPTGTIPSTSNLRIRFIMGTVVTGLQFRIDDVKLVGCLIPSTPTVTYTSPACNSTTISLPANVCLETSATGTSTTVSTTVTSTSTYYARRYSSVSGCSSVWSPAYGPFTVTINTTPTISASPIGVNCNVSDNVSFISTSPNSYVWQLSTDGGTTWNNLTISSPYSVVGDTLKVTSVLLSMNGYKYRTLASNPPCIDVSSTTAILTVIMPLPITLISFYGEHVGNTNVITWKTATEINNEKFILERSSNVNNWISITEIPGSGTSTSTKTYSYVDMSPDNGVNYYRLTQVDWDGHREVFKIIVIENKKSSNNVIYYDFQELMSGREVKSVVPDYNKVYLRSVNGKMEKVVLIK
jgi:hypothetical protein